MQNADKEHNDIISFISKIIRERDYQTITIKVHEGRVTRILREESILFSNEHNRKKAVSNT